MIQGINHVVVSGYAGADAQVKFTQGGTSTGRFSVGIKNFGKDKDGNDKPTSWVTVKTFGKTAENCGQYVKKGSGVCVAGRLEEEHWQSKEGQPMKALVLIANDVRFNFEANGNGNGQATQPAAAAPAQSAPRQAAPAPRPNGRAAAPAGPPADVQQAMQQFDDDVPF